MQKEFPVTSFLQMANIIDFKGGFEDLKAAVNKASGLVVVDFYAPWCPGCRRLGQLLPGIAGGHEDVQFLKVDVDENAELKTHYGITSIPVVKFVKGAGGDIQELATVQGANIPEIKSKIDQLK